MDELKGGRALSAQKSGQNESEKSKPAPAETTEERNRRPRPWQSRAPENGQKSLFAGSALVRTPKPEEKAISAVNPAESVKTEQKSLYYSVVDNNSPLGPLPEPSPELTAYPPGPTLESGRPRFYPETGERVPPPPAHIYPLGLSDDKPWRRVVWLAGGALGCFDSDLKRAEVKFLG